MLGGGIHTGVNLSTLVAGGLSRRASRRPTVRRLCTLLTTVGESKPSPSRHDTPVPYLPHSRLFRRGSLRRRKRGGLNTA